MEKNYVKGGKEAGRLEIQFEKNTTEINKEFKMKSAFSNNKKRKNFVNFLEIFSMKKIMISSPSRAFHWKSFYFSNKNFG